MNYETAKTLLAQIAGCTFAGMDTETVPYLKGGKANPMQGKLIKRANSHRVILFSNANSNGYENKVKRHLEREGKNPESFKLGALPWGERIEGTPFIQNKGKVYLQCIFLESGKVEYVASDFIDNLDGKWWNAGEVVPAHLIEGLPETTGSEKQGLEDEVIVRTFALDSIKALRAFNEQLV